MSCFPVTIGGVPVTQTQIKNDFSNAYVDDVTTPLNFTLEYKTCDDDTPNTVNWDSAKSTESVIFFPVLDSLYAEYATYMIIPFWTIATEKIYASEPVQLVVKDLHRGV